MYFEDIEWCYRARLLGFEILAAPRSVCLHAFGSQVPTGEGKSLSPEKLRRVTYGRLRFITLLNNPISWLRFFLSYLVEDILRGLVYLLKARWSLLGAMARGWRDFGRTLPEIRLVKRELYARRQISAQMLYKLQKGAPVPLIQAGIPVMTWDIICTEYAPLFLAGKTHPVPEMDHYLQTNEVVSSAKIHTRRSFLIRAFRIYQIEGAAQLLHRIGRQIQWRLMQP
jgi:hypothetical protein